MGIVAVGIWRQWQRLSLARIHLRDAPIWILDEPTSAIDEGRVVERGRYDELLATGGRFAEIFAEQAG